MTISKPGSLARASGYDELDMSVPAILPSLTGLSRARLRPWEGSGEETLKELDVDRLALTPDRPSETTLSDITAASLVVANSLAWHERKASVDDGYDDRRLKGKTKLTDRIHLRQCRR